MFVQSQQIIKLTGNIIFRDTYHFVSVKLPKLPETMALEGNLKNGDFQILFNTV